MRAVECNGILAVSDDDHFSAVISGVEFSIPKKEWADFQVKNINKNSLNGAKILLSSKANGSSNAGIHAFVSSLLQSGFRGDIKLSNPAETKKIFLEISKANIKLNAILPGMYSEKFGHVVSGGLFASNYDFPVVDLYCNSRQRKELKNINILNEETFPISSSEKIYRLVISLDDLETSVISSNGII